LFGDFKSRVGYPLSGRADCRWRLCTAGSGKGQDRRSLNAPTNADPGIGGKQDVGEARRLLNKAAQAGSLEAKRILASVNGAKAK
jgi:hypothetical protein